MIDIILSICGIIAACAAIWKPLGLQKYLSERRKAKIIKESYDAFIEEHNRPRVYRGGSIPPEKSETRKKK